MKVPLYALGGVPEVWVVDLHHGEVLFFRSLAGSAYRECTSTARPSRTVIGALPQAAVDLTALLG